MSRLKITDATTDRRVTTVGVRIKLPGRPAVHGRGSSKCCAEDVFSAQVGVDLALGRAIKDAGDQIAHAASLRVVTKDELARVRALLAE